MALTESLLTAICRANGDALVMHVGEKPYVVVGTATKELSAQHLSLDVVSGMLTQLLPEDVLRGLSEFGAAEHILPPQPGLEDYGFTIVVAKTADDIWIEIRRLAIAERIRETAPVAAVAAKDPVKPSAAPRAETRSEPSAVIVPMTRTVRIEVPTRAVSPSSGGIERLLRIAATRGASSLYLTSQARPLLRVDGDIRAVENEPALAAADVESVILELMPENTRDAFRRGEPTEFVVEMPDVGRVRCTTFHDYNGPGALFQFVSTRPLSAEHLVLTRETQALASEPDGLVLVASPHGGGKSTIISAFVDLVNRQRSSYVITLESQLRVVHEPRKSLISQREVRRSTDDVVVMAQAALRESPDVLVIEDAGAAPAFQVALDAAGAGLLVFVSTTARSTTGAIARLLDSFPPERRTIVQEALADRLRGAFAQVLLRKVHGGHVPVRELLLAVSSVPGLLRAGQLSQLNLAIEAGRKYGMLPMNDSLLAAVRSGSVDVREAYRAAEDRGVFLTLLQRNGIDTSVVERLA